MGNVELNNTVDTLRCANDSTLETRGKAMVEVEIDGRYHTVNFMIVQHMSPDVIVGIGLQKQFGIELHWPSTTNEIERNSHICNIETKFGRKITH